MNLLSYHILCISDTLIQLIIEYIRTHADTHVQHLDKMKSLEDVHGQAVALENIAKTYEYMANLTKACETLEQVCTLCIIIQ